MSLQSIRKYAKDGFNVGLDYSRYFDITLLNENILYDEEVIFSNSIIAEDYGDRLPINIDLSSDYCSDKKRLLWDVKHVNHSIISKNHINHDESCETVNDICNVGLNFVDHGLTNNMVNSPISYTMSLSEENKFNPNFYDLRFKMRPVNTFAEKPNLRLENNELTSYNIVSKENSSVGYYNELYGGYYQGFYKLFGYDYEVFPERCEKGWTSEMMIKPRQRDEFERPMGKKYINDVYPENGGFFFYMGTKSENKFSSIGDDLDDIQTCNTNDLSGDVRENEKDVLSNAIGVRFSGDPKNPKVCVKYIKLTGDCVTNETCDSTETFYDENYVIKEICSTNGIYDMCNYDNFLCEDKNTEERWVMVSVVFERYKTLTGTDLETSGGLGLIRSCETEESINNESHLLIDSSKPKESIKTRTKLNKKWIDELDNRLGLLKVYINGFLFLVIEDFEEIIPRELNTDKEKQIGIPFNISFGGGSNGLREHLSFDSTDNLDGPYKQYDNLLNNPSLSIESNFAGSFMGGVSQFRMYSEPLNSSQTQHNFRVLKEKYDLFDFWCPNCYGCLQDCYFNFDVTQELCDFDFSVCEVECDFDITVSEITCDFDLVVKPL